jgi:hypothetical protein
MESVCRLCSATFVGNVNEGMSDWEMYHIPNCPGQPALQIPSVPPAGAVA